MAPIVSKTEGGALAADPPILYVSSVGVIGVISSRTRWAYPYSVPFDLSSHALDSSKESYVRHEVAYGE
jgi:hypothetical protein